MKRAKCVVSGISLRTHGGNFACWCIPDHPQNRWDLGHCLLIFLFFASLLFCETGKIRGFRTFPGERMKGIAWNFACWCILGIFRNNQIMLMVFRFFSNLGFPGISRSTYRGNSLKFCMLMYPDHFENWLDLVMLCWFSSLFLIMVPLWLWLWNWSYLGLWDIILGTPGSKCRGAGVRVIFPTLRIEFCLVDIYIWKKYVRLAYYIVMESHCWMLL